MRVGVYGDSQTSSLPDLLSKVGHDVSYMDYDPAPPPFEELDLVLLEVRDTLLESAVERLAQRARRGQIFIHTSLQHGVLIMDPLEVTGAVVIALGELSPTRWAVTTLDELGDTIAELLLGELGASGVRCLDEDRVRLAAAVTYVEAVNSLHRDAVSMLGELVDDLQEADDIAASRSNLTRLPDAASLRARWQAIDDPGRARAFRQVVRRVAETHRNQDIELWAIQEEKL